MTAASPPVPAARSHRLCAAVLFALLWLTFGYFNHLAAGWNVNTRLGLVYALVEEGSFSIDKYHDSPPTYTEDKAFYGGHFYCDKSPALSFLAAPLYYPLWQARLHGGWLAEIHTHRYGLWVFWTRYLLTLCTSALAAAVLGVLLFGLGLRFLLRPAPAFGLSAALCLGTVLSGYATLFYAYLPAALCCTACWVLLLDGRLADSAPGRPDPALAGGSRLFLAGLLLGLSWFFEFTSGLAGIGLAGYAAWTVRNRTQCLWKFVLGGLLPVAAFYAYTYHVFGEFAVPYQFEYDAFFRSEMAKGFQGIHLPRLDVLYYVTVHPFKGLFFYSPFLALALPGATAALRRANRRFLPDVLLGLLVIAAYLAFNAGYYMWWGGWAAGPRLLCPAIVFFLPPLALWIRAAGWKAGVFVVLALVSIALQFMITATDPQVPTGTDTAVLLQATRADNLPSPILEALLPGFVRGELARNLGTELLGLSGLRSLLPLALAWAAGILLLSVKASRRGSRTPGTSRAPGG